MCPFRCHAVATEGHDAGRRTRRGRGREGQRLPSDGGGVVDGEGQSGGRHRDHERLRGGAGALRPSDGANDAVTWYEPTGREPMTTEARPPATATVPVTAPENWTVPVGAGVKRSS